MSDRFGEFLMQYEEYLRGERTYDDIMELAMPRLPEVFPRPRHSILIVGPDGVGKTTIAKRMSEITGMPTFKCPTEKQIFTKGGGRQSLAFDYTLTHFIEQTRTHFISDRAYPCEWVYSKVFFRDTDDELLDRIDTRHSQIGTKILYMYSSVQPTEPDDIVPSEKYWDVKRAYDRFVQWTHCDIVSYDTAGSLPMGNGAARAEWDTRRCLELLFPTPPAKYVMEKK